MDSYSHFGPKYPFLASPSWVFGLPSIFGAYFWSFWGGSGLLNGYHKILAAWRHLANELRLVTLSLLALNLRTGSCRWKAPGIRTATAAFNKDSLSLSVYLTYAIVQFERHKCLLIAIDLCLRRDFIS